MMLLNCTRCPHPLKQVSGSEMLLAVRGSLLPVIRVVKIEVMIRE